MKYQVKVSDHAAASIRRTVHYIAKERQAPLNAERWLENLWDAVDSLEFMPHRCRLADENAYRPYEIRRLIVGNYLFLFTIDEPAHVVNIIGFRHAMQLPAPDELPRSPSD